MIGDIKKLVLFMLGQLFLTETVTSQKLPEGRFKKKVVILTCHSGYGHQAACTALTEQLSDEYQVKIINPLEEILSEFDAVKNLSLGKFSAEAIYNSMITNGWIGFTNWFCKYIGASALCGKQAKIEQKFSDFLHKEKPDLLISVIPMVNLPASNAAKKLSIPFLVITLDGDLTNWALGLHKISHPNYFVTVAANIPSTNPVLERKGIPATQIKTIGFPVRKDFLEKKDTKKIRNAWGVPDNRFIIMLMMGGNGSLLTYRYAKKLLACNIDAHMLICVGKNKKLTKKILKLPTSKMVTFSVIPFTNKISDLMAISHVFITKPGPNSINEAIHMQLPLLLDTTSTILFWEQANIALVKQYKLGDVVQQLGTLETLVKKYVQDKNFYADIKSHMQTYPHRFFHQHLRTIIKQLEQQKQSQEFCV